MIISGYHVNEILSARNGAMRISLDLGISKSEITKSQDSVAFPGCSLETGLLEKYSGKRHQHDCFLVSKKGLKRVYEFFGNHIYRLYEPHKDWPPTLSIDGSMMHTVSVSKPTEEARIKAEALGDIKGSSLLDTCFGLGYTAITAGKSGALVSSFEKSDVVLEMAKLNPWSRKAFSSRIRIANESIEDAIKEMDDGSFDFALHDPPNVQLEGNLYSESFYSELHRVVRRGGRIYHFVGSGRIQKNSKNYLPGVIRRLSSAGFSNVRKSYRGVVASRQ